MIFPYFVFLKYTVTSVPPATAIFEVAFSLNAGEVNWQVISNETPAGARRAPGTTNNSPEYGSQIKLTATAKEGYEFVRWSDGDNHASRTIEVTGDIYLQAIFQDPTNPIDGIEEVGMQQSAMSAQKVLRDGVLYIICPDGKTYNAQGAEVR